ncbi:MAG: hypothetical protein NZ519_13065 [Bacteroidia bacterium]|nr:hypothetical protein [Bacteroidia bacterium]
MGVPLWAFYCGHVHNKGGMLQATCGMPLVSAKGTRPKNKIAFQYHIL